MNINIICVGDIKEKYLKDAIKEYQKRIKAYSNISVHEIQEERISANPYQAEIVQAMDKEGCRIIDKINPRSYVFALCVEGKQMTSEAFSRKFEDITLEGFSDITFIIGGSNGLSTNVKKIAHHKLSFSQMTYPHQLMRVILLEQIYRAYKILRNEPYHK